MRIHQLTITAFGPFGQRADIDFDALGSDGLFLLAGPTGAGKTSILDAIVFALYGSVPGARNSADQLRSQYATASTVTFVAMEFSVRGRRFRVERTPKYQRPKKSGTGTTTQRAIAHLTEYKNGKFAGVARTAQAVTEEIIAAIGLNMKQFTQVVLLPQGDFANFLRANADQRGPLLEKLFGTERFSAVEDYFRSLSQEASAAIAQAAAERSKVIEHAYSEVGLDIGAEPFDSSIGGVEKHLAIAVTQAREHCTVHTHVAELAQSVLNSTQITRNTYAQRLSDARNWRELRRHEAELTRLEGAVAESRARIRLHRAAQELAPLHVRFTNGADKLHSAQNAMTLAQAQLPQSVDPLTSDEALSKYRAAIVAVTNRALALHEAALLSEKRAAATEDVARVRSQLADTNETLSTLSDRIKELEQEEEALNQNDIRQRAVLARERFDQRQQFEHTVAQLKEDTSDLNESLAALTTDLAAAQQELARHQQQRIAKLTGMLAQALVDGKPCQVCGSTEHPRPAEALQDGKLNGSEDEWQSRVNRLNADRARLETSKEERARALVQLRDTFAHVHGDGLDQKLEELFHEAESLGAQLEEHEHRLADIVRALRAARTEQSQLTAYHNQLFEESAQAQQNLAEITAQVQAHQHDIGGATRAQIEELGFTWIDEADALSTMRETMQQHLKAVESFVEAKNSLDWLQQEFREAEEAFTRALVASEFANTEDWATAAQLNIDADDLAVAQYERLVGAIEHQRSEPWWARGAHEDLSLDELEHNDRVWEQRLKAQATVVQEAKNKEFSATRTLEKILEIRSNFRHTTEATRTKTQRAEEIVRLAKFITGTEAQTLNRTRLSAFVLFELFNRVVQAATHHLQHMSAGRYSLVRDAHKRAGEVRSGLALSVIDAFTQEKRDVRTLSGGETFMASLALALGLADTVATSRGGLEIGSLFIDEGFGSLDQDTLNMVMEVLDQLRAGGRTIGIISHVTSMHDAIPFQIEVKPGPHGSTLVMRGE